MDISELEMNECITKIKSQIFPNKKKLSTGYHLTEIPKGNFGEVSKIIEEALELQDAEKQNNAILCLCELSDLYGAFIGYLEAKFPQFKLVDIQKMSEATNRAFESGQRTPRTT